jgi:hypothetical protein
MGDLSSDGVLFLRTGAKRCSTPPLSLIGMMSRSRLFLSGSVSTGARLRFSGRFHLHANRLETVNLHPQWVEEFSTGEMRYFQPALTIRLTFINDVRRADFYVSASTLVREHDFDKMLERMHRDRGSWLAQAKVEGCDRARGEEIGALAIDLALAMLQLALPTSWNTRNISRLDARRGGADSQTFSRTATTESGSHSSHDAGVTIGEGTMQKILQDFSKLANAVGICVTAFASGRFHLPNLQRSFCDAAYWFHEALAEKIDSIAIVKLETSLEVLLRSQSSKGSQARIRSVLEAFYGLASKGPVVPGSTQTADDFAKSIVGDRSQFLHGTLSTLQPHIGIDREGLEEFVQAVLRRAVIELANYSNLATPSDRVEDFLDWVRDCSANAVQVTGQESLLSYRCQWRTDLLRRGQRPARHGLGSWGRDAGTQSEYGN